MFSTENSDYRTRIEQTTGKKISEVQRIQRGYTPAERWLITFADNTSAFAKIGTTPRTSAWLREEKYIYETLQGSFKAEILGWHDDGEHPILLLEDLRNAHWPPPWRESQIHLVLETLPTIWESTVPNLRRIEHFRGIHKGWQAIAENPEPFLSLELVTEKWLQVALPILTNIDGEQAIRGESFLHLDIRSDNLCIQGNRVVMIDWNLVCLGNPRIDLGFWLPSLESEGGPPPETILPHAGDIAGIVSGFFASHAGETEIPDAPLVRQVQKMQLGTALPWVVRALDLPPLDGNRAKELS